MFKKKKVPTVVTPPSTQEMIASATKKIESDITSCSAQKDSALSVFRQTATKLEAVNKRLAVSLDDLSALMQFAQERKESVEQAITDNDAVKNKILEIIGN